MADSPFAKAAQVALAHMRHARLGDPPDPPPAAGTTEKKPDSAQGDGDVLFQTEILRLWKALWRDKPPSMETYQEREEREKREWEEFLQRLREIARISGEPWSPEVKAKLKARAAAHLVDLDRETRRHQTERPLQTEHRDRPTHAASSRSSPLSMSSSAPNQRATWDEAGENWMERGSRLYDTRTADEKRLDDERNAKASMPERANSNQRRDRGGYER